jgi:hypothetical protein
MLFRGGVGGLLCRLLVDYERYAHHKSGDAKQPDEAAPFAPLLGSDVDLFRGR